MLFLRTGLPGASKTLNTLKEIIEDSSLDRPKFYNNIRLLLLDFEVCSSFSGFFYGYYLETLDKNERNKIDKIILRVHKEDRFVTLEDVPFLSVFYQPWLETGGSFTLWCKWVFRVYPKKHSAKLQEYLDLTDVSSYDFKHVENFNFHFTKFDDPLSWFYLPKSSIILIDECQQFFPPRPVGSKVPKHASEFETHRHHGFDIHLVTQDAKLLDNHVRRLTGRHINYHNPLASNRVNRLQADKVFEPSDYFQRKNAISTLIKRDSNFYGLYWSADIHTHKIVIPKKMVLMIVGFLLFPFLIYFILGRFKPSEENLINENESQLVIQNNDVFSEQVLPSNNKIINTYPSLLSSSLAHPLSFCDFLTYSARVYAIKDGQIKRDIYIQCDIKSEKQKQDDDSSEENKLGFASYLYNKEYLNDLGYTLNLSGEILHLNYKNIRLSFPPL